jgi:phenylacetate-CoA ligase
VEKRLLNPRFETAERSEILAFQLKKLSALIEQTWHHSAFYRDIWLQQGAKPVQIDSFETFHAAIPIARKGDLIADQAATPPYGKRLAAVRSGGQPCIVMNTSGTSGQGVELHAMTHAERARAFEVSAYLYRWAGLQPGDELFLCYGISLLGGGRIEIYGMEDYGLSVFPVATYDVRRKLELIETFQPRSIMAILSYLGHLSAVRAEMGFRHRPKVLFGGGEGASLHWFESQQELWGAPIFNHYGSTQSRVDHMYPCERGIGSHARPGMLHNIEPGFYVEFIDPETGNHVKDGERGEIVVTSLIHTDFPLIRHAMGDIAVYRDWRYCPCGRPFSGMEIGTVSRIDDMKKIKGINVWPQAVDQAVFMHPGVEDYQVVLSRDAAHADIATIRIVTAAESESAHNHLCANISAELRRRIGVGFNVVPATPGEVPRSDYKTRRWIDNRNRDSTPAT